MLWMVWMRRGHTIPHHQCASQDDATLASLLAIIPATLGLTFAGFLRIKTTLIQAALNPQ